MTGRTVSTAAAVKRIQTDLDAGLRLHTSVAGAIAFTRRHLARTGQRLDAEEIEAVVNALIGSLQTAIDKFDEETG